MFAGCLLVGFAIGLFLGNMIAGTLFGLGVVHPCRCYAMDNKKK